MSPTCLDTSKYLLVPLDTSDWAFTAISKLFTDLLTHLLTDLLTEISLNGATILICAKMLFYKTPREAIVEFEETRITLII